MPQLDLDRISRAFGAVQALNGVSLSLRSGEVHALMGENGAGKSTLIRLLAGLDRPDGGQITISATATHGLTPAQSKASGLRFIHQELHPVPGLSVAENMHLDLPYPKRFGLVDWAALNRAARKALDRLGLGSLDPRTPMTALGSGDQMLVRIAATLVGGDGTPPWLYVMDEPTAALTTAESERLFEVIAGLVRQGAGVLYVSHRMPEVVRLADRVTVLRDGEVVSSRPLSETSASQIIEEMTGRQLDAIFPPRPTDKTVGPMVLRIAGLAAGRLKSATFDLRAGEVLGVAGIAGSGRGALLQAILGAIPRQVGQATLGGQPLRSSPVGTWAQGIAYVPRERRSEGLMLRRSIAETIVLPHLGALARAALFLNPTRQRQVAKERGAEVLLKARSVQQACQDLSGGNQQKVMFARALAGTPRVLLLDEPTRGVDIGARVEIYRLIGQLREAGLAVILASSDLPELIGLSTRIAVMRDGHLAEILPADGLTEARLLSRFYHRHQEESLSA